MLMKLFVKRNKSINLMEKISPTKKKTLHKKRINYYQAIKNKRKKNIGKRLSKRKRALPQAGFLANRDLKCMFGW